MTKIRRRGLIVKQYIGVSNKPGGIQAETSGWKGVLLGVTMALGTIGGLLFAYNAFGVEQS